MSPDTPPVRVRERGPRTFEELPPSEVLAVALSLSTEEYGSAPHRRAILARFDHAVLTAIPGMRFPLRREGVRAVSLVRPIRRARCAGVGFPGFAAGPNPVFRLGPGWK